MAQSAAPTTNQVLSLLSLDGGGIRGLSELLILDEIMHRIKSNRGLTELPRPCDHFDLIGGSGTGGLIALLLGRLRMSTDEALRAYSLLAGAIFSDANRNWTSKDGSAFEAITLEKKVQELVSEKMLGECMLDTSNQLNKGKTFVCAMAAASLASPARRFRTYPVTERSNLSCSIWEAARATTAVPTLFKPIVIDDLYGLYKREFIAGIRRNNPVDQVLEEANELFGGDKAVGCLVSIRAGHPDIIGLAEPDVFQRTLPITLVHSLKEIAMDCERTAIALNKKSKQLKDLEFPRFYFRFNLVCGTSLEEWERIEDITQHTKAYMANIRVSKAIDEVVSRLCTPRDTRPTLWDVLQVRNK